MTGPAYAGPASLWLVMWIGPDGHEERGHPWMAARHCEQWRGGGVERMGDGPPAAQGRSTLGS